MIISKQIFDSLTNELSLQKLIDEKQTEGLYLEFKQKKNNSNGELENEDKKNFSEGLSQFANSDGGVQIWGIETKKPGDFAASLKPIKEVGKFFDRLSSYLKDAVQPIVDGLLIEIIYRDSTEDVGYIKILIPYSEKTPHRSMSSREYYKRNIQGKYRLEHFDLEDMFGRRQKPALSLELENKNKIDFQKMIENVDAEGYLPPINFEIYLVNNGRAIGRDCMIIFMLPEDKILKFEFKKRAGNYSRLDDMHNAPTIQLNLNESKFYPEVNTRIGEFNINLHKEYVYDGINIKWIIYAENMIKKEGVCSLF